MRRECNTMRGDACIIPSSVVAGRAGAATSSSPVHQQQYQHPHPHQQQQVPKDYDRRGSSGASVQRYPQGSRHLEAPQNADSWEECMQEPSSAIQRPQLENTFVRVVRNPYAQPGPPPSLPQRLTVQQQIPTARHTQPSASLNNSTSVPHYSTPAVVAPCTSSVAAASAPTRSFAAVSPSVLPDSQDITTTLYLRGLPPSISCGAQLVSYVPPHGLVSLRVKWVIQRDVGFAQYNSRASAEAALTWFRAAKQLRELALYATQMHTGPFEDSDYSRLPPSQHNYYQQQPQQQQQRRQQHESSVYMGRSSSSSSFIPAQGCVSSRGGSLAIEDLSVPSRDALPLPYMGLELFTLNPIRHARLLLRSIVLEAEWARSQLTYRPRQPPPQQQQQPYHFQQQPQQQQQQQQGMRLQQPSIALSQWPHSTDSMSDGINSNYSGNAHQDEPQEWGRPGSLSGYTVGPPQEYQFSLSPPPQPRQEQQGIGQRSAYRDGGGGGSDGGARQQQAYASTGCSSGSMAAAAAVVPSSRVSIKRERVGLGMEANLFAYSDPNTSYMSSGSIASPYTSDPHRGSNSFSAGSGSRCRVTGQPMDDSAIANTSYSSFGMTRHTALANSSSSNSWGIGSLRRHSLQASSVANVGSHSNSNPNHNSSSSSKDHSSTVLHSQIHEGPSFLPTEMMEEGEVEEEQEVTFTGQSTGGSDEVNMLPTRSLFIKLRRNSSPSAVTTVGVTCSTSDKAVYEEIGLVPRNSDVYEEGKKDEGQEDPPAQPRPPLPLDFYNGPGDDLGTLPSDSVQGSGDRFRRAFSASSAAIAAVATRSTSSVSSVEVSTQQQRQRQQEEDYRLACHVLRECFFTERFAGVQCYRGFLDPPFRGGCFVRFERPGDALQCLRWMRGHPSIGDLFSVQFARQDCFWK